MGIEANAAGVLGAVAMGSAIVLSWAAKKFRFQTDPRLDQLLEVLPCANCGACGYASCEAFAGALLNEEALVNGCVAGGAEVAEKVSAVLGVTCEDVCAIKARVACNGGANCSDKFDYSGIRECGAASLISSGQKSCDQACLGFGDCLRACPFDAIVMKEGLPEIQWDKCTGCGACVEACPKHVIHLAPADKLVHVMCRNIEVGADVMKKCSVGCIACRICEKACPVDAIHVVNNVARVDYEKCVNCGLCVQKCPKKIITKKMLEKTPMKEDSGEKQEYAGSEGGDSMVRGG